MNRTHWLSVTTVDGEHVTSCTWPLSTEQAALENLTAIQRHGLPIEAMQPAGDVGTNELLAILWPQEAGHG